VQIEQRKAAAAQAAVEKIEKKLAAAREELDKAEHVLQHDSTQAALAGRFRFDNSGAASEELVEGKWIVRVLLQPVASSTNSLSAFVFALGTYLCCVGR
jgi:zona occludens toxin (predicted ATPase)